VSEEPERGFHAVDALGYGLPGEAVPLGGAEDGETFDECPRGSQCSEFLQGPIGVRDIGEDTGSNDYIGWPKGIGGLVDRIEEPDSWVIDHGAGGTGDFRKLDNRPLDRTEPIEPGAILEETGAESAAEIEDCTRLAGAGGEAGQGREQWPFGAGVFEKDSVPFMVCRARGEGPMRTRIGLAHGTGTI
jgi:hypothetical protein